ncbi:hypothetical protein CMP1-38 [Clavibacter phage CMP1]|uniref:Uncharacterized protein n=1 Tax=Clavibacter phage CMP1 TaxID=686439 RepID=D0U222_9CAUD|nr:hypothetical protein CMP1-38 [Clavibacter phage CMP1]ACY35934.1 hypothetical protein CMP1-38 [Clavibacter phage CMP1]
MEFMSLILNSEGTGWGAFGGLAVFAVVSVIRGWFIPGRTHDREMATEKRRGDEWKESAQAVAAQNAEFLKAITNINDFFRKVSADGNSDSSSRGGGDNVLAP